VSSFASFCDTALTPLIAPMSRAAIRWEGIQNPKGKMRK
jgi:hypothetical protein